MQVEVVLDGGAPWGFRLDRSAVGDGQCIVMSRINANSKAHLAGINVGDVVRVVNDTATSGLTQYDVMKLVQRSRDRLCLLLQRDHSISMTSTTGLFSEVIMGTQVHSPDVSKTTVISDINGNITKECRAVESRDCHQPITFAREYEKEHGELAGSSECPVPPPVDIPLLPVVANGDQEANLYTSSMYDSTSSGVAEVVSRLPTLQNPLIMLLKKNRVQQKSKSVTLGLVEDKQTNYSEPPLVASSSDEGRCREPAESNNMPRADEKLSSLTETLNFKNGFYHQSRDNEKILETVDRVNRKWSTYESNQSRVDMKDIPTTTKNSLDAESQREWYKSMYRSLHKVETKPDSFVFAGADPDPRMSVVAVSANKSPTVSNVSTKSSPESFTDDVDVTHRPFRSRSISNSYSTRQSINKLLKRKSLQLTGGPYKPDSSPDPVEARTEPTSNSPTGPTAMPAMLNDKDLNQTTLSSAEATSVNASSAANALRQHVKSCARRPSSMIELPEKQSTDCAEEYKPIEDQEYQTPSVIPEWAHIAPSVTHGRVNGTPLSPGFTVNDEPWKEQQFQQQQVRQQKPKRPNSIQPFGSATALYPFTAQSKRELSFDRGDTIVLLKQIDRNWFEGQCHGATGVFPASYIEVNEIVDTLNGISLGEEGIATATYSFVAETHLELSFNKGDTITLLRRIDTNWYEARIDGRHGIVPLNHLFVSREPCDIRMTSYTGLGATADKSPYPRLTSSRPSDVSERRSSSVISNSMNGLQPEVTQQDISLSRYSPSHLVPEVNTVVTDDAASVSRYSANQQRRRSSRDHADIRASSSPQFYNALRSDDVTNSDRSNNSAEMRSTVGERHQPMTSRETVNQSVSGMQQSRNSSATDDERLRQAVTARSTERTGDRRPDRRLGHLPAVYRAAYNYRSRRPDELDLTVDDVIYVRDICDDGWFWGSSQRTNQFGSFPGNYVRPL